MSDVDRTNRLPHSVLTPLVMPFTTDGAPDFESLARQASWVIDHGASGVWLNGTTGEFYALTEEERTQSVRSVAEALGGRGVPIASQIGAPATRLAVRLAEQAVAAGATVVAAVLPYYMTYDQDECKAYLREVKRAAQVPLYLYQVPAMTKLTLSDASIIDLIKDGTLTGMKDSWGNMTWLRYLLEKVKVQGLDFEAFMGDAALMMAGMATGVVGMITAVADVIPRHIGRGVKAVHSGDWTLAAEVQSEAVEFLESLKVPGRPATTPRIPSLKVLLAELGAIETPLNAGPFREFDTTERAWLVNNALPIAERLEAAAMASESAGAAA